MKSDLTASVQAKTEAEGELINILQGETTKLSEVEHVISCHADLIGITRLFLNFLTTSDKISDSDIEELTRMIIFIRQARLGITRDQYKYVNGSYIYECRLPPSYFAPYLKYPCNIDTAREKLATILVPLVQYKFMPRWEWDSKQLQEMMKKCIDMYPKFCDLIRVICPSMSAG